MDKKKIKLYLITTIISVALVSAGIALAYFLAVASTGNASLVEVQTADNATLTFQKGNDLKIDAGITNFTENGNNLSSSTTASATLYAKEDYSALYNIEFVINDNDFVYTTDEETPELMLVVTAPDNTKITNISGLTYTESNGVQGFDVTTKTGTFTIDLAYEITTTAGTSSTDTWTFELYCRGYS